MIFGLLPYRHPAAMRRQHPKKHLTCPQLVAYSPRLHKLPVCQTQREKLNIQGRKEQRQQKERKRTNWRTSFPCNFCILAWALHYVSLYMFFRQRGALMNEQSGALVRASNYYTARCFYRNIEATERKILNLMSVKGHLNYSGDKQDHG